MMYEDSGIVCDAVVSIISAKVASKAYRPHLVYTILKRPEHVLRSVIRYAAYSKQTKGFIGVTDSY
jgi:hypothetical protein